jgi:arylsulfatase A-like enzyme
MRPRAVLGRFAVVLAPGLAATLVAAAIVAWRAAAPHEYWAAGMYRLLVTLACERFDRWLSWAVAAAAAAAFAGSALARRGPRPGVVRAAAVVLALVGALRALVAVDAWRAAQGPNLLLISIDTLRADRLGAYGYPLPTSPTLDRRLAGEGVTFLDVYSQSPKTTPSHMTMLTSLYPCVHGIALWWGDRPAYVLNPAVHTLAEVLRNAGFTTAAFTGGAHMDHSRGFDHGFQVYEDLGAGAELGRGLRWLKHNRRWRFFLFYHTYQVHDPYLPPPHLVEAFAPDYTGPILDTVKELRRGGARYVELSRRFWASVDRSDPRAVDFVERLYAAGIRNMDDNTLTRLLDALVQWGVERDTLVVFTSDHGEAFNEHGVFLHDDLYAGTLRVPLVLRFPGRLPAGRTVAARARIIDVMPTILDLLGVPPPPGIQGRSLLPYVRDDAGGRDAPSEHDPAEGVVYESLRSGSLSYIAGPPGEFLFDLTVDPEETGNLAPERPDTLAALRAARDARRTECGRLAKLYGPTTVAVTPDEAQLRRLRALGYLQ